MAQFLNPYTLKQELIKLFREAENFIFLVSPFIKLNDEMKRALSRKKDDVDFEIVILFGKNEFDLSKSLSKDDMEFFKLFKNVEISYNADLHAKFYANESKTIITSLNLHQYSVKNNIEVGVLVARKRFDLTGDNNLDTESFNYFNDVIDGSETIYEHSTQQESSFFGLFKGELKKTINQDKTNTVYPSAKIVTQFDSRNKNIGYCIRTGQEIEFNLKSPFSKEAYASWSKWKNKDFKESFCHFSGERSNGETSFAKPVLLKYYKAALNS